MRFRPCIDLHSGVVKQIVGSTLVDGDGGAGDEPTTNFEAAHPSAHFAETYKRDGFPGGHVIMLGPGNTEAALSALRAYPGGMQVGGGINPTNAREYLDAGASHVIVTSYVFRDGKIDFARLDELVAAVGKERLVIDLSCRKRQQRQQVVGAGAGAGAGVEAEAEAEAEADADTYYVVTDRWQKYTDFALSAASLARLATYCDEFLVHGVDVEGLRVGVIEELVARLGEWSPIPVTYAGGARSLADMETVRRLGGGRVDLTIGSALDMFGGDLKWDDIIAWQKAQDEA